MAKRKRLIPAPSTPISDAPDGPLETKALTNGWAGYRQRPAPIADVAGSAATQAALEEVASEMSDARREGRLVQRVPLDAIDETHLVRDRISVDATEMDALVSSLRARGQQTPLEVVDLGRGQFGLISGWRRLVALKRLRADGVDVAGALCLIRAPETATDAYVAMVEENEIRAGLSFYERARISMRAAEQGAYPTAKTAIKGLFANSSRSKRSKVASFLGVYEALDDVLKFPGAITEKQGLGLSKLLESDAEAAAKLRVALMRARAETAEDEQAVLNAALSGDAPAPPPAVPVTKAQTPVTEPAPRPDVGPAVKLTHAKGRIILSGSGVDQVLAEDLAAWLAARE